jgi:DNA-binding transcriptional regulator YhcF (GntR family)
MTDRVSQIASGEPWEEKTVKALWFHIVREQVQSGEIARVGAVPWAVYCAVKSHTGLETGDAFPSNARIAALVGVSMDTVQRALKKLAEAGLVSAVKRRGKGSSYSVTEKIPLDDAKGEPWATAERKYIPLQFTNFVAELQRLATTGNLPTDKGITINLVVQNVFGEHAQVSVNAKYDAPDKPEV